MYDRLWQNSQHHQGKYLSPLCPWLLLLHPQSFESLNISFWKVKYNLYFSLSECLYLRGCCGVSQIFDFTPEIKQQQQKLTLSTMCLACILWCHLMRRLGSANHSNTRHLVAFTTHRCLRLPQCCWRWPCGCRLAAAAVSREPFPLSG